MSESHDKVLDLITEIQDLEAELEEMNECGDLEDRMECAIRLEAAKAAHFKAVMMEGGERE